VRRAAHVLLTTGDHHVGFTALDRLGCQVQRLKPGATDVVDGNGRDGVG